MQSTCTIPLRKKVKDNEDSRFSSFVCTFSSHPPSCDSPNTPQNSSHVPLHSHVKVTQPLNKTSATSLRHLLKLSPKLWCRAGSSAVHKVEELLNTVLLSSALRISGGGDALGALVVVVLGSGALLGLDALC